jgi:hypothetical protein
MTDYSAWDKFDESKALLEVDERSQLESLQDGLDRSYKDSIRQNESVVKEMKRSIDILNSKAAVAALKSSRPIGSASRRSKTNSQVCFLNFKIECSTQQAAYILFYFLNIYMLLLSEIR